MTSFLRDVRVGARSLSRQPAASVLAILTLSLGIGANAVIFSLLYAVLLRPLPFHDPDRLVAIVDNFGTDGTSNVPPTVPELLDVRAASRHLDGLSFYDLRDVQTTGGSEPARAVAARVEWSFLATLGVRPALGRLFVDGEGTPGRDRFVILTDGFWRRSFGGDTAAVGRQIVVNGVSNTVVGVLPPDFSFDYHAPEPIELFIPFPLNDAYMSRAADFANVRRVTAIARLKRESTVGQASAEVEAISRAIATDHAALYRRGSDGRDLGFAMSVAPLREILVGRGRSVVLLLFGAVGLVLLIACVNTAHFLLARAVERQQEVMVRTALGAGRGRLLQQFLTEAFVLATLATAAGIVQAAWLMEVLRAALASRSPFATELAIDATIVAFCAVVGFLVTIGFGLFPAIHFSRPMSAADLKGRTTITGRSSTRQLLIAIEVAMSVVLLVGAGLLAQSLWRLQTAPVGFSADDVTVMRMRAAGAAPGGTGTLYQRYLERIAAIPGVAAAAFADAPLPGFPGVEFSVIGRADDAGTLSRQRASWRIVSPGYFDTLRIPLLEGRTFADDDATGRPPVAIVNEEMARRFWPGESAIGRQIRSGVGPRSAVTTIVGVVGNVRPVALRETAPQIYVSYLQQSEPSITLLVRSHPGAHVLAGAVKQAVWSAVPDQPLFDIRSMHDVMAQSINEPKVIAQLLGSFAALALLMSTMGVYAVVTYLTSRRTREVALRQAIGAASFDVLRLLAGPTIRSTLFGLMLGVVGAIAVSNVLRATILRETALDFSTVTVISLVYLGVVAGAVCVPAARALRVDPATILRAE